MSNGALKTMFVFNDVVVIAPKKESKRKNKEDKISSRERGSNQSTTKIGQSPKVKKKKATCYHYGK